MPRIRHIIDIGLAFARGEICGLELRVLHAAARSLAPAPLFVFGPASPIVNQEIFGQFEVDLVGCYSLQDALVAPTGIAISGETAFTSQAFLHPSYHVTNIADRVGAHALPERFVAGPLAVIYGPAHQTYGHWLVDFLPRLWVLHAAGYDLAQVRFVIPPDLSPIAAAMLAACGIGPEQLVRYAYWREILRTDCLLMPTGLRRDNRISPCFAAATAFWTARVQSHGGRAPSHAGANIFVSRGEVDAAAGGRVMTNRHAIETMAQARGYAVVHPEQMDLAAQVALFSQARAIMGEYGSALHGSVFAAPGSVVCGLRGTSRHPSFVQSGIAGALGQHVGYVLGATPGQEIAQRFSVNPDDVRCAMDIMEMVG